MTKTASNTGYAQEAPRLLERYESFPSDAVHAHWRDLIPDTPSCTLDIGAGTGRDAAWLVSLGHTVLAVEPTDALRTGAARLHPEPEITWLDDALPDLDRTRARSETFDLVMLNAVWMHLSREERDIGFPILASLLAPGGRLFMSQRHGPIPEGRRMFEVTGQETIERAERLGLKTLYQRRSGSILGENQKRGVEWTCLVFEKP